MICQPGKKILFMGGEIGQWKEWDCKSNIDWHLLEYSPHQGIFEMVRSLNNFYLSHPPLWELDFVWKGYEWIDFSDAEHSVISYFRKGLEKSLVCVHNFTPEYHSKYLIPLKGVQEAREVFNTDASEYGGSNQLNLNIQVEKEGFLIALAPLATMIFEVQFVL